MKEIAWIHLQCLGQVALCDSPFSRLGNQFQDPELEITEPYWPSLSVKVQPILLGHTYPQAFLLSSGGN